MFKCSLLHLLLLVGLFAVSGCDTTDGVDRKEERARREAEQARMRAAYLGRIHEAESEVWQVLHPLIEKAANYREEETFGYVGAVFVSEDFYSEALVREARAEGFGGFVSVLTVIPDSPAESAGLQAGDRLVSVNGVAAPTGQRAAPFAVKKVKRLLEPEKVAELEVLRGEEVLRLEIEPVAGAYYAVVIVASNEVDLHVDGDVIWIGLSLVESLEKGGDLANLCAYALAKSVMRHPKQKGKNAFLGQLLDVAAAASGVGTGGLFSSMGGNAYSHAFEVEADLIALYLLASSGYEIETYPDFWDRALRSRSRRGELTAKEAERVEISRGLVVSLKEKLAAEEEIFPEAYLQGDVSELE